MDQKQYQLVVSLSGMIATLIFNLFSQVRIDQENLFLIVFFSASDLGSLF